MQFNAERIIKLLQIKGIGKGKVFRLSEIVSNGVDDDNSFADFILEHLRVLKIPSITKDEILASFTKGSELYELSIEKNIKIIALGSAEYPELLKNITNPPLILNALGNLNAILKMPGFAVIGTREPSKYGRQIGERIGYILGESKINVVSGLAIGCDSAAHIGCLRANGITTAVLAHGLDAIYPKENSGLAQSILDNNGCLVSEYLIKTKSQPSFFVERDRIQAGLSEGTFVIETDIKGGTMHTVGFTKEYDRILAAFCHPADKQNDKSRGNEMLIANGSALKIENQEDIHALVRRVIPLPSEPVTEKPVRIDAIQLPAFDLDALIDKDYHLAKKKLKRKKSKTKKSKGTSSQKKMFEE